MFVPDWITPRVFKALPQLLAGALIAILIAMLSACGAQEDPETMLFPPEDEAEPQPNVSPALPPQVDTSAWLQAYGSIDAPALAAWLRGRYHRGWNGSSRVFPSQEGGTRVFLNPTLATSLENRAADHPVGSIGVRELYQDDLTTPRAFNLLLKQDAPLSQGGPRWIWYELVELNPGGLPSIHSPDAPRCIECHSTATDFIHSAWPLR